MRKEKLQCEVETAVALLEFLRALRGPGRNSRNFPLSRNVFKRPPFITVSWPTPRSSSRTCRVAAVLSGPLL